MFIYGKNFFDNTDKVYTDMSEFETVNELNTVKDWIDTNVTPTYGISPEFSLSSNKKLVLMKVDWANELDFINAKTDTPNWGPLGDDNNFVRVTEDLYNEYK
jgi:hypothetical protein